MKSNKSIETNNVSLVLSCADSMSQSVIHLALYFPLKEKIITFIRIKYYI